MKKSGGLDGVRDNNLLESALQAPFQTFGGDELYPTFRKRQHVFAMVWLIIIILLMETSGSEYWS